MSKKKEQPVPTSSYKKRELKYQGSIQERLARLIGYQHAQGEVPEPTYACPCMDVGWVPVEDEDVPPNTWKPCARCQPDRFARWAEGQFAPSGARKVAPKTETPAERNRRDLL